MMTKDVVMAMAPFRIRCANGEHTGVVHGRLFCTACGRSRSETDAKYGRQLDEAIVMYGDACPDPADTISFKEVWLRIITEGPEDNVAAADGEDEDLVA